MRIVSLLARHGTVAHGEAIDALDALFERRLPAVARDLLVIDNALPAGHHAPLGAGRDLIGGSNAAWEFSAWDAGIAWLGPRLEDYDLVHLATSAFGALYTRYLERLDAALLGLLRGRGAALGHLDYYGEPVSFGQRTLRSWLRSSFLFLPPTDLRLLGSLVTLRDPAPLFSGRPESPFRPDAPLSPRYRRYLLEWLTGSGTGQGVAWHSRFDLTAASLPRFEAKALAILNEQLLSARLRAQGCALVDVTWLATRHAALAPHEPLGAIPAWRWQVTGRDSDAAPAALVARD